MTDALGHATAYAYDAQTRFADDLAGRLTGVTDPTNNVTAYGYDHADSLTGHCRTLVATPGSTGARCARCARCAK